MRPACPTRKRFDLQTSLQEITSPERSIVQEPRLLNPALRQAAALWVAHGPALFLRRGTVEILETELDAVMPAGTLLLIDDALDLARRYQRLSETAEIRFRLEKITHDSCRRFHVDTVPLRLLCTYTGPGVQWKHADNDDIHDTPSGWLTMLKGTQYPNWSEDGAVLHRSPPLSNLEIPVTRLLLTLDHPDACGMNVAALPSSGR